MITKTVRRVSVAGALAAVASLAILSSVAPAIGADAHVLITGSGSSWSQNAVNQWIADVQNSGLQVVYTGTGSAQGRKDFSYYTNDFAVSDIGFQGVDSLTGDSDTSNGRAFAYLPVVAGGTAFPYQVRVGGKLVRNLRLSGLTLVKIFTNQITNWNDPAIAADNNGRKLPSLPVIPVVHSEGSGSSAQLTAYFNDQFPAIWAGFLGKQKATEYFPRKGSALAQNGSDGVMNFVASSAANGAIGYDEYSYALAKDYPVVQVENKAGYFQLPTQYNVAVGLTKATINTDKKSPNYLLQQLHGVYTNSDARAYPLSSYSYMIIPTGAGDKRMTTAKRQTIADYLFYSICTGQKEMGPIGYSPLPVNLVSAGFQQLALLKSADSGVNLTNRAVSACNNPTFIAGQPNRNYLAEIAPAPRACDKVGAGPCTTQASSGQNNPPTPGTKSGSTPTPGATTGTGTTPTGGASPGTSAAPSGSVDPATGQVVGGANNASGDGASGSSDVYIEPVDIAAASSSSVATIGGVAILVLGLVLVCPPLLATYLSRRRGGV